jgi:dimethylargininase
MIAITHKPSPRMDACELSFIEREPIDYALALLQHEGYCRMLSDCGAEARTLEINLLMPDCVFVEDTAVVLDEVAVMASMGTESRRAEPPGIEAELRKFRSIQRIELPATLEGGDVLRVGRKLLVGRSARTNAAGIKALDEIARGHGYEVLPVTLRDCLHLKSACTALPDGSLLVNPDWLDLKTVDGFELVQIPKAEPFAADILLVGNVVCVTRSHPQTVELIRKRGFEVSAVDLSEFAKAEGGVTCLSILFEKG